jgi:hypothetical protein
MMMVARTGKISHSIWYKYGGLATLGLVHPLLSKRQHFLMTDTMAPGPLQMLRVMWQRQQQQVLAKHGRTWPNMAEQQALAILKGEERKGDSSG